MSGEHYLMCHRGDTGIHFDKRQCDLCPTQTDQYWHIKNGRLVVCADCLEKTESCEGCDFEDLKENLTLIIKPHCSYYLCRVCEKEEE